MSRCRRCGEGLSAAESVEWGLGPTCLRHMGLTAADRLPQRCGCCSYTQSALQLLYGLTGYPRHIIRHDGSSGWLDTATGEVVKGAGRGAQAQRRPA